MSSTSSVPDAMKGIYEKEGQNLVDRTRVQVEHQGKLDDAKSWAQIAKDAARGNG
ncbi:hypothetical protein [Inquilinus sp. OTU3971]|uniref:hypothetical protein n=1 Tax=Inquilinus sp. OTU3971 TaxID=3043855 RepID=UPI00313BCDA2